LVHCQCYQWRVAAWQVKVSSELTIQLATINGVSHLLRMSFM